MTTRPVYIQIPTNIPDKSLFNSALSTLLYSWGGDTPAEAIWASNQFLDFYERVYGVTLSGRFSEMDYDHNTELLLELERS